MEVSHDRQGLDASLRIPSSSARHSTTTEALVEPVMTPSALCRRRKSDGQALMRNAVTWERPEGERRRIGCAFA